MKRTILYIALFFITAGVFAQPNNKRIKAMKIAYITERLELTETEAEKFWPIYNAFENKLSELKHGELRTIRMELRKNYDNLSEKRAQELLDRFVEIENTLYDEKVKYVDKLKKVLPAKKIILLKAIEDEFNKMLMEQLKKRRMERQKRNKP